jgi:hypothetical protein
MAFNNGGTHRPEKKNFIVALVKAINENKAQLGTKPPKGRK